LSLVMRVRVERGPGVGDFGVRPGERVTAGRARECALAISDPSLSRRHFELAWDGKACHLKDLGSRNGTSVNGARVGEAWLRDGDTIEAGDTLLRVAMPALPAPAPQPPRAAAVPARAAAPQPRVAPARAPSPPSAPPVPALAAKPASPRQPVEIYANVAPSQAEAPAVRPAPGSPLGELAMLLAESGDAPLYALIDCAAGLDLALASRRRGVKLFSLFEASLAPAIGHSGPALAPLGDDPLPFLAEWASRRDANLGVLVESRAPLPQLYAHLASLFEVSDARGNAFYRRFYDPRVLRPLVASTPAAERAALFGPIERIVAAGESGGFVAYAPREATHR
jgi:hypothetical protein